MRDARSGSKAKAGARDWARSLPASLSLVGTMLALDLPLRVVGRRGDASQMMDAGQLLAHAMWGCFRITGAHIRVEGREQLVPGERYVVLANHQGFSDVIVLSTVLHDYRPRYVAKRELAHGWPSVSYMLRASGSAVIDRKQPSEAKAAIEGLGRRAAEGGWTTAIFPEGTRAKDGVPRRWKVGGAKALVEASGVARVLPVSLSGGSEFFAYGGLPFKAGVELGCRIHPPVPVPVAGEDFGEWLEQVRLTVAAGVRAAPA